jgi:hypothetical protein
LEPILWIRFGRESAHDTDLAFVTAVDHFNIVSPACGIQVVVQVLRRVGILSKDQAFAFFEGLACQPFQQCLQFGILCWGNGRNQCENFFNS